MAEPNEDQYPESYFCPLTHQLMNDPVVDPEGNSYEREAITQWLQQNATSPVTRAALTVKDLVPNRALKDAIEERRKKLGDPKPKPEAAKPQVEATENPTGVTVSVTTTKTFTNKNELLAKVSINTPEGTTRTPCDICCVVDISGSMDSEATMKNSSGKNESHGLSILDVVKHAVKTIVKSLKPTDRMSLVTYSDTATKVFGLTKMDPAGRQMAYDKVTSLQTEGCTNLWDGINTGLEILRTSGRPSTMGAVMVLTDGLPNVSPPRGELAMMKKYKEKNGLNCSLNTFGFGYSLDSKLLAELAVEGDGSYAFIPDSGFVGTVFVNATANLLSTMARTVTLSIEPSDGVTVVKDPALDVNPTKYTSWGASINLASLQFGQSKEVVVRLSVPEGTDMSNVVEATIKYTCPGKEPIEASATGGYLKDDLSAEEHRHRLMVVDCVAHAVKQGKAGQLHKAKALITALIAEIQGSASCSSEHIVTLLEDLTGQITETVSKKEWFKKWGCHYLPSLARAHLLQQCNNFKDPGVQHYGGKLFRDLRDEIEDRFCTLPPPKPSRKVSTRSGSSYSRPVASMSTYNNRSAPCFDGSCTVLMADGSLKRVENITKGDMVKTCGGPAQVTCVIKTLCARNQTQLVTLEGGLRVTPYHPIRIEGKWQFPCNIKQSTPRICNAVYSFALDSEHVMLINGIECVTLGHNFTDDLVVQHPFFGSQVVIDELKSMPGWERGLVQFSGECMMKDKSTGLVSGFAKNQLITCRN